jgi:hypothetical protein
MMSLVSKIRTSDVWYQPMLLLIAGLFLLVFSMLARADHQLTLNKFDFLSVAKVPVTGGVLLKAKLSESGKGKFKVFNRGSVNRPVHVEIAGVSTNFILRLPIEGDQLEMGPYSLADADRVAAEVNGQTLLSRTPLCCY